MTKIGIMGGTFNPIHLAHIKMAEASMEQAGLDEVWFMPSKNPPHKDRQSILPEKIRSDMVRLAIDNCPGFIFSDFELKREGVTYSAETLTMLTEIYPEALFFFIMGADSFMHIEHWHRPDIIMKKAILLCVGRNTTDEEMLSQKVLLEKKYSARIKLIEMEQMNISSSYVRKEISEGRLPKAMLSDRVADYITENKLYQK